MIRFSFHAQKRIAERGLSLDWIKEAIAAPDGTKQDVDPMLTHSYKAIAAFGGRILKVVHRPEGQDILVVTAYFDRNARR